MKDIKNMDNLDRKERSMSLMVDYPIPVENSDYVYYLGELVDSNLGIYCWLHNEGRFIIRRDAIEAKYSEEGVSRKLKTFLSKKKSLGFVSAKSDSEIINLMVNVLNQ